MQYYYTIDKIRVKEKGSKPLDSGAVVIWRGYNSDGELTVEDVATGRVAKVDKLEFNSCAIAVSDAGSLDAMRAEGKTLHYTRSMRVFGVSSLLSIIAFIFAYFIKATKLLTGASATTLVGMAALALGYCVVKFFSARRQLKQMGASSNEDKSDITED